MVGNIGAKELYTSTDIENTVSKFKIKFNSLKGNATIRFSGSQMWLRDFNSIVAKITLDLCGINKVPKFCLVLVWTAEQCNICGKICKSRGALYFHRSTKHRDALRKYHKT